MRKSRSTLIRASEISEYIFCARAWRLRLDGHRPAAGRGARVAGEEWHRQHGRSVQRARRLNVLALGCLILALLVALALMLRWGR